MRIFFTLWSLVCLASAVSAQLHLSGDTLFVNSGAVLYINTSLSATDTARLELRDSLIVTADVSLEDGTAMAGTGWLALNGSSTQNLDFGNTAVSKLKLGKPTGAQLTADAQISDSLHFEQGKLDIGSHNLLVGEADLDSGAISGASATAYVQTSGTGQLIRHVDGNSFFPIGNSSYNPAKVSLNLADSAGLRVEDVLYEDYFPAATAQTDDAVNRAWFLSKGSLADTAGLSLYWQAAEELPGFDRDSSALVFFDTAASSFNYQSGFGTSATHAGFYTQSRSNISDFNTYFTVMSSILCSGDGFTYVFNNGWNSDPSGIAGPCDSIVIASGAASISSFTAARMLILEPNTTLDLGSSEMLVEDSAYVLADATGYAQIIGKVKGPARWETYLSSASPRWYNNTFPIKGRVEDIEGALINITGNASTQNIWWYDATVDLGNINEGTWKMASATDSLGARAYEIFLSNNFGGSSALLAAKGELLNGNQEIAVSINSENTEGWNYIPNPYPSSLDFDELVSQNSGILNHTYYIQSGPSGTNIYQTYDATFGTGTNGGTKDLAPGQAFFVEALTSATLSLNNSQRNFSTPALYKTTGAKVDLLKLSAANTSTNQYDQTVIGFDHSFSFGEGSKGEDSKKIFNYAYPNLYTGINGEAMVFNGLSNQFQSHSEALYFECSIDGTYSINIDQDNVPPAWTVSLEDKLLNTFNDLRAGNYSFSHISPNQPDRFVVHINTNGIGMTELISNESGIYAYMDEEKMMVNLENYDRATDLYVYDMSGKLLIEKPNVEGNQVMGLNTARLAKGVYLLKVASTGSKLLYTQKLNKY